TVLPSTYTVSVKDIHSSDYDPVSTVVINNLVVTTNQLEDEKVILYRSPEYAKLPVWLLVTNGQTVAITPSGHIIKVVTASHHQQTLAKRVMLVFMILSSVAAFLVLQRLIRNQTNKIRK